MKPSIIYLGILATMFVNVTVANGIDKEQYQSEDQANAIVSLDSVSSESTLKKPEVSSETETTFLNTTSNAGATSKSMEEIIEEDKKITEYQDEFMQPLIVDRAIQEVIKEDNQIIENTLTDETYPLDFELINKFENAITTEQFKNTAFKKATLKS